MELFAQHTLHLREVYTYYPFQIIDGYDISIIAVSFQIDNVMDVNPKKLNLCIQEEINWFHNKGFIGYRIEESYVL